MKKVGQGRELGKRIGCCRLSTQLLNRLREKDEKREVQTLVLTNDAGCVTVLETLYRSCIIGTSPIVSQDFNDQ